MTIRHESTTEDTLGGIGEAAALERIFPRLPAASAQLLGAGDDAAVVAAPDGRFVVTTDMMIHGPDFRLAWSTPVDLGWKAAASNLADVAAMGAVPTALVVAIAAPENSPVSLLEGIADGFRLACAALSPGCGVVGGDLSVSSVLTIAVTAFGDLEGREPVLRSGARPGDIVAVSGLLGVAGAGIRLLFERGVDSHGTPDAALAASLRTEYADLINAQLAPRPPIADGRAAALAGATAMIDLSDGLAIDACRVATASDVGIDLDSAALHSAALDSAALDSAALGGDPEQALAGAEDHSLLAAFPPWTTLPAGFRAIGRVLAGTGLLLDGHPHGIGGWDPYRGWDGGRG